MVVRPRAEHCVSRRNIDAEALKVLRRLSDLGYTAYLVGGSVRDLLMGRKPKDFDVGTDAHPTDIRNTFRNCFLIGRRFRLAHIVFGKKVIETSTFRRSPDATDDEYGHYQFEDNTFGTPEEDAKRRDFTINGLFYDIKTFAVIDYVGGLKDLDKRVLRSIGDPNVRFREDPVRMMRAIRFAARLDFSIDRASRKAIHKYHADILNASPPRVCEEVYRLFMFGASCKSFRMMWEYGLMKDLLPKLDDCVRASGGKKAMLWRYLAALDADAIGEGASNGLRTAVLYYPIFKAHLASEKQKIPQGKINWLSVARNSLAEISDHLHLPKMALLTAQYLMDHQRRFEEEPRRDTRTFRFIQHEDFEMAFALRRIVLAAEGADMTLFDRWQAFCHEKGNPRPGSHEQGRQNRERRRRMRDRKRGNGGASGEDAPRADPAGSPPAEGN